MDAALEKLKNFQSKRNNLLEELRVSLEIQKIWPEVFKSGRVSTYLKSPIRAKRNEIKLVIRNGEGEEREYPIEIAEKIYPKLKDVK